MVNNATKDLFSIYAAIPEFEYEMEEPVSEDEVDRAAKQVFSLSGNVPMADMVYEGVLVEDYKIQFPCVHSIEGITTYYSIGYNLGDIVLSLNPFSPNFVGGNYDQSILQNPNISLPITIDYYSITYGGFNANKNIPNTQLGQLLDYHWDNQGFLRFNFCYGRVNIFAKDYFRDENGTAMVGQKLIRAITMQLVHNRVKLRYRKRIANLQDVQIAERDLAYHIKKSREPEELNENAVNQILDTLTSYHRHGFGRSSKIWR